MSHRQYGTTVRPYFDWHKSTDQLMVTLPFRNCTLPCKFFYWNAFKTSKRKRGLRVTLIECHYTLKLEIYLVNIKRFERLSYQLISCVIVWSFWLITQSESPVESLLINSYFVCSFQASCPDPVAPINGRAIDLKPGYRHGERAKFSCDSGFKLIGSSNIRCLDGNWSSTAPLCTGIVRLRFFDRLKCNRRPKEHIIQYS